MKLHLLLMTLLAALLAAPAAAAGPVLKLTEDVTGDVLVCGDYVFTAAGTVTLIVHEGAAANGNTHVTMTIVPRFTLVDQHGQTYAIRGTIGGTMVTNAVGGSELATATHNLEIVGRGKGVVASIRMVERFRNDELVVRDFGSCELP